jgi:hypothetical protein
MFDYCVCICVIGCIYYNSLYVPVLLILYLLIRKRSGSLDGQVVRIEGSIRKVRLQMQLLASQNKNTWSEFVMAVKIPVVIFWAIQEICMHSLKICV